MTGLDQARRLAAALPEATSGAHHGTEDARVRKKIFATFREDGGLVLKTTPENLDALVRSDPSAFERVWGERWVRVDPERIDEERLRALIIDSWKLAAPKALSRTLEESGA